jgi:hypothetical protein
LIEITGLEPFADLKNTDEKKTGHHWPVFHDCGLAG